MCIYTHEWLWFHNATKENAITVENEDDAPGNREYGTKSEEDTTKVNSEETIYEELHHSQAKAELTS